MIRTPKLTAIALTVAASLVLPIAGIAQDRSPSAPRESKTAPSIPVNAAADVRLSKLIGMKINDPAGHTLGTIKAVILDTNTGRVHYAVMSFGGALGSGAKMFAVPLSNQRRRSTATGGRTGTTPPPARRSINVTACNPAISTRASGARVT